MFRSRTLKTIAAALIFLFAAVFCGCAHKKSAEKPMGEKGTWSIYLYMCGSNLESEMGAAGRNIDELLAAEIPPNVNVIIETGGAERWRSHDIPSDAVCRYRVNNGALTLLEKLPQADMGASGTLRDFLLYGVKNYPAEKMCAILWDHGGGSIKGVCNDENYVFDPLTIDEMDEAFKQVKNSMTDRFEVIGFDACLMANYDTAEMLTPYARYMIASEEIEPSGGWDYSALISAIKDNASANATYTGGDFGKAVCDGYMEKCRVNGKDSTATLSVIDLSAFGGVVKAFNDMAGEMEVNVDGDRGIHTIAQCAKSSPKYGGNSNTEGYSNLIDLRRFAENYSTSEFSAALQQALGGAVKYVVRGRAKSAAGGLSFYYPCHFDENQLREYSNDVCLSQTYRDYLEAVYGNIPDKTVEFTNAGYEADDGSFGIKLTEASAKYVLSVDFDLTQFILKEDGSLISVSFGRDNDISGTITDCHSNFRGVWVALNGCKLFVTPVEVNPEYNIYTAPIILNGKETNLRFAFVWDDSYSNDGYYKILGAWDGIDSVTGMSDKELTLLQPTDEIKTYKPYRNISLDDAGELVFGEKGVWDEEVPQGEYVIEEDPLRDKAYIYQFVVTDIFGREYYSDIACLFMTKTYEELKDHPLEDGEYAAKIGGDIIKSNGVSIVASSFR